ncbi:chemotaxis-specific protein-glutamate methyltransferase CheB [Georgenia subflava]|uniref:chemotaxis-specific protein-glutamate methyltransferase CheB n=1 Tax=Georgenia subflava TaxID=1622177 RepID=UPI00221EE65E|nr:chemotaxis-specific protein-glutamate methyltransferase CheB [Georgenia subflava]
MRVLVVDDSAVMRRLVAGALRRDPTVDVIGNAADGRSALGQVVELLPDVVTMDVEMPELDGISAVRALRRAGLRVPVIMLSTLTERGADATLDALAAGASDYVTKPGTSRSLNESLFRLARDLLPRVHALVAGSAAADLAAPADPGVPDVVAREIRAVVVGSSTGGPEALSRIFGALEAPVAVPVLVVQHMPPVFTRQLAARLDRGGPTRVHEAVHGTVLEAGHAYIAPGDRHLSVARHADRVYAVVDDGAPVHFYRPSVDVLFRSAAEVYGAGLHAVVLTGMGTDGADGAAAVVAAGGTVTVQDAESAVVWGMPGAVVTAGHAHRVSSLDSIARALAVLGQPVTSDATSWEVTG